MSGGGGNTNTVQTADPWTGQQPHLRNIFGIGERNFNNPPGFYPNATYVPFSQQSEQALGMAQNRAMGGSPVEGAMQNWVTNTLYNPGGGQTQNYLQGLMGQPPSFFGGNTPGLAQQNINQTLGGGFLNSNPYLDDVFRDATRNVKDSFSESVMPAINATFGGAGRTGSGTHGLTVGRAAGDLGDALAGMGANLYGGNYQQERGRQMQALGLGSQDYQFGQNLGLGAAGEAQRGMGILGSLQQGAAGLAPTAAGLDWQNIDRLRGVGSQVEGMAGNALSDQMNRFNFYQNRPDDALARYVAAVQGNYGSATTSNTNADSNPMAGVLGGGMTGAALGSMMGAGSGLAAGAGPMATLGAFAPWLAGGALLGGLLF